MASQKFKKTGLWCPRTAKFKKKQFSMILSEYPNALWPTDILGVKV